MYAHALYGAGMRNLKRPVDLLEKDLSSVATMVAGHKKLNTLFQVSANDVCVCVCYASDIAAAACAVKGSADVGGQDPTVSRAAKKDVSAPSFHNITSHRITSHHITSRDTCHALS